MTGAAASRALKEVVTAGAKRNAAEEAAQRKARLQRYAGRYSRTLDVEAEPGSTTAPRGLHKSKCMDGPSAPPPRGWTASSGARFGPPVAASLVPGPQVPAEDARSARAVSRIERAVERDPLALESSLGFCEENAIRPRSTPGYQRFFLLLLTFLATLPEWGCKEQHVAPSMVARIARIDPPMLDGSVVDFFDHLYFTGAMASEAEKTKAALCHYVSFLVFATDCPRGSRALQGFLKMAPGKSRFPLPMEILGALVGWLCFWGHHEMATALLTLFICYLRPAELMSLRICDVIFRKSDCIVNLAPGDTLRVTKTGLQDEGVRAENMIWPLLGKSLMIFIKEKGLTIA